VRPWLAVTTVAVPVVCLAPVVTIASLSRVPAAAVRLVRHAPASEIPAAPVARRVPFPRVADAPPAPGRSTTATTLTGAPSGAAAADRTAVPEIALDEPVPAATSEPVPSAGPGLEPVAAPSTPLRDAIAAAQITPGPARSRTRFDEPDLQRRVLNWVHGQRVVLSFDPYRPNYEVR
jgi:hypothetical protein